MNKNKIIISDEDAKNWFDSKTIGLDEAVDDFVKAVYDYAYEKGKRDGKKEIEEKLNIKIDFGKND